MLFFAPLHFHHFSFILAQCRLVPLRNGSSQKHPCWQRFIFSLILWTYKYLKTFNFAQKLLFYYFSNFHYLQPSINWLWICAWQQSLTLELISFKNYVVPLSGFWQLYASKTKLSMFCFNYSLTLCFSFSKSPTGYLVLHFLWPVAGRKFGLISSDIKMGSKLKFHQWSVQLCKCITT